MSLIDWEKQLKIPRNFNYVWVFLAKCPAFRFAAGRHYDSLRSCRWKCAFAYHI